MNNVIDKSLFGPENILDSIADGVYVTDLERRIVFWNQSAERITGWKKQDILGKSCMDQILCHVDKAGRALCGKDTCPLFRSITTGKAATDPIIIYGKTSSGLRLAMQVVVAPIYNRDNDVVGGVEVFRDMTGNMKDLTRAKEIQIKSFKWNMTNHSRFSAAVHNIPFDMIGGDYYAVEQLSDHQYVFLLADVMGHGVSAALYTMYLRSLWDEYFGCFPDIVSFINQMNSQLNQLMSGSFSFAAAICGLLDLDRRELSLVGGGIPSPFLFKAETGASMLNMSGLALGMIQNAEYKSHTFQFAPGDVLFLYTDGAVEIRNRNNDMLQEKGLLDILYSIAYPDKRFLHHQIEERLIRYSADISFNDDITFLEFRFSG